MQTCTRVEPDETWRWQAEDLRSACTFFSGWGLEPKVQGPKSLTCSLLLWVKRQKNGWGKAGCNRVGKPRWNQEITLARDSKGYGGRKSVKDMQAAVAKEATTIRVKHYWSCRSKSSSGHKKVYEAGPHTRTLREFVREGFSRWSGKILIQEPHNGTPEELSYKHP